MILIHRKRISGKRKINLIYALQWCDTEYIRTKTSSETWMWITYSGKDWHKNDLFVLHWVKLITRSAHMPGTFVDNDYKGQRVNKIRFATIWFQYDKWQRQQWNKIDGRRRFWQEFWLAVSVILWSKSYVNAKKHSSCVTWQGTRIIFNGNSYHISYWS